MSPERVCEHAYTLARLLEVLERVVDRVGCSAEGLDALVINPKALGYHLEQDRLGQLINLSKKK